jgi:hypothetical protein
LGGLFGRAKDKYWFRDFFYAHSNIVLQGCLMEWNDMRPFDCYKPPQSAPQRIASASWQNLLFDYWTQPEINAQSGPKLPDRSLVVASQTCALGLQCVFDSVHRLFSFY